MNEAASVAVQRVGSTLNGKYRLEQLLGIGGMAAVYRGTHRNGHRVAVKVLHPNVAVSVELRDRFLREGYVANRVDHRGAVRVIDDDTTADGSVFLVMELLEGETLEARRGRSGKRLPHGEVALLARQLLDVLAAAHDKGIVHRDIKPENLFLTGEGVLKVLDFGIARLRDLAGDGATTATRTGHVLGTPAYMPPEQVLGRTREIDAQTDLWAVGATMFTLISGHYVHDAENITELLVYAGSRAARRLASVAPEVPAPLANVVDRALSFDKADRWPDARAMGSALQGALDAAQQERGTAQPGAREPPPRAAGPTTESLAVAASMSSTGGPGSRSGPRPSGSRVGRSARAAIAITSAAVALGAATLLIGFWRRTTESVVQPSIASATSPESRIEPPHWTQPPAPSAEAPAATDAGAPPAARTARPAIAPAHPAASPASPQLTSRLPSAASGTPANPPPAKANCDPPFTIDTAGRRIPKPECL